MKKKTKKVEKMKYPSVNIKKVENGFYVHEFAKSYVDDKFLVFASMEEVVEWLEKRFK